MTDHDEVHTALEDRLIKRLRAEVAELARTAAAAEPLRDLAERVEAIERKLGEVEGDREPLPSDIPKPL